MPYAQPPRDDAKHANRLLQVAILVPGSPVGALPRQAVRLLAGLSGDPAFSVRVFAGPVPLLPPRSEPVPLFVAAVLAAERLLLPPPRRTALPVLPPVVIEPLDLARDTAWDVVVDLGGGPVDADLATVPRHGLWRIAATPLRTAIAGDTFTEATLVRHGGTTAQDRMIARAIYDTKPLATHNAAYLSEKSAQLILREAKRCARDAAPRDLGPVGLSAPGGRPAAAFGYLARTARKALRRIGNRIAHQLGQFPQGFSLRLGRGSAQNFDPATMRPVQMPPVSLWADPFLIAHQGSVYCFFEDIDPAVGHGHISVGRVTETGLADVQTALRQPHHMSYPFVFHHEGAMMMMPEVHAAARLEVWRCTVFPSQWELYATAFDGTPLADSVLFERDGTWWLFTHISRDSFGDFCSDLHVFRVDGPKLTGLVPHRLNPVVTDASTARGGGRVHQADGRLLRFSQDNSGGCYGYGLNMMEVVSLDLDHYEERCVRRIVPDFAPGLIGCHHFDTLDGWVVIDVRHA